ncbi:phage tail protein [Rhodanobacter sp. BL-MT-08]
MSKYTTQTVSLAGALEAMADIGHIPARIVSLQKRALSTLQRKLATEAKRSIGEEYNLTAARIAEGLSARMTPDGISLIGKARGINAIEFGATWSRVKGSGLVATSSKRKFTAVKYGSKLRGDSALGAKYAIKRGGDRGAQPGTFIARGKNGALLVFTRAGKKRLPLEGIYGPSIGQMLKHGRRPERLVDFAIRTLQSEQARLLGSTP